MARSRAVAVRTRRVYVGRRRARRSRAGFGERGISLAVIGGFIPTVIDAWNMGQARTGSPGGMWAGFGHQLLLDMTGFNTDDHKFYPSRLFTGWGPIVAGYVVHKLADRIGINRTIRKYIPMISI